MGLKLRAVGCSAAGGLSGNGLTVSRWPCVVVRQWAASQPGAKVSCRSCVACGVRLELVY